MHSFGSRSLSWGATESHDAHAMKNLFFNEEKKFFFFLCMLASYQICSTYCHSHKVAKESQKHPNPTALIPPTASLCTGLGIELGRQRYRALQRRHSGINTQKGRNEQAQQHQMMCRNEAISLCEHGGYCSMAKTAGKQLS
jgi:hypothetical protein